MMIKKEHFLRHQMAIGSGCHLQVSARVRTAAIMEKRDTIGRLFLTRRIACLLSLWMSLFLIQVCIWGAETAVIASGLFKKKNNNEKTSGNSSDVEAP